MAYNVLMGTLNPTHSLTRVRSTPSVGEWQELHDVSPPRREKTFQGSGQCHNKRLAKAYRATDRTPANV